MLNNSSTSQPYGQQQHHIIILDIGIANGRGDWLHALKISQYLRKILPSNYLLYAFARRLGDDVHSEIRAALIKEKYKGLFKNFYYYSETTRCFYYDENNQYRYGSYSDLSIRACFKDIIRSESDRILTILRISLIDRKFILSYTSQHDAPFNEALQNILILNIDEHGHMRSEGTEDTINLKMGFGKERYGIRRYPLPPPNPCDYYYALSRSQPMLYDHLMAYAPELKTLPLATQVSNYLDNRCLLPADLRDDDNVYAFILFNLSRYRSGCDFYLSAEVLASLDFKKLIEETCQKMNLSCEFISPQLPSTRRNLADVRFFSGYPLNDNEYRGLYLSNNGAGAGSSGDDSACIILSTYNLPWFSAHTEGQHNFHTDLISLAKKHYLTALINYLKLMGLKDDTFRGELIRNIFSVETQIDVIQIQWNMLVTLIQAHYNFYRVLYKVIDMTISGKKSNLSLQQLKDKVKALLTSISAYQEKQSPFYKNII